MLKKFTFLLAALTLVLASCTSNTNKNEVAKLRAKHAQYLANSPFRKTQELSKEERKKMGIPPNKYLERQWELTMNPEIGRPTPEKLYEIQHQVKENFQRRSVPGTNGIPWVSRGPGNIGGRTKAILFDPADATHKRVFAGGVSGGLWVNDDITDPNSEWALTSYPHNLAVSSITYDPNNTQNMFIGTGESYTYGSVNGNGIWRSTDGGQTWEHVFGGKDGATYLTSNGKLHISSPSSLQGDYHAVNADFGDKDYTSFSGNLVLVNDGSGTPTLGCNSLTNAAAIDGNIAVIERGTCNFDDKVKNAQIAGAIGVIMINNVDGPPITMAGDDTSVTIPSVMISKSDGAAILNALNNSITVTVTVTNNHTEFAYGYVVPGITHINDIVTRVVNDHTEIYASAGDSFYADAYPFTVMGYGSKGVYKSVDNGATWQQLNIPLDPDNKKYTPFDLEIGADNKIWLTTIRSVVDGTAHGAILSSTDGQNFGVAVPIDNAGRIELAVSKSTAGKMYAFIVLYANATSTGTVRGVKTTNGFASTPSFFNPPNDSYLSGNDFTNGQAFYDLFIEVDPNNDNTVYVGGINIFKSTDGCSHWSQLTSAYGSGANDDIHPDQHGIAFADSQHILFGNDGGVAYSGNSGTTIVHQNNKFNVTQFYHMAVGPTTAFNGDYFMAGAQDNGTQLFENAPLNVADSEEAQGGDGAYCFFDQDGTDKYRISNYVYNNSINLYNYVTNSQKVVNMESGTNGDFINQEALDSHLNILYTNYTSRSASGDYTYTIKRFSNLLGTINKSNIQDPKFDSSPTALKVSPYTTTSSKLFVGLQNGKLLRVDNANSNPNFVDITGDEFVGSISDIEFGQTENDIFVTMFNYGVKNIFYSSDGGTSWLNKEGNLPDMPVNTILQNPLNTNEVIVGTDLGIWATPNFNDANPTWYPTQNGMADVKVTDLELRNDNMVFASTYGRGVFSGQFTNAAGIKEGKTINVTVYPNPASEQVKIQLPENMSVTAYVYDINGRQVLSRSIENADNLKFEVSNLSKGYYFVKMQNGKTNYIAKFIKK